MPSSISRLVMRREKIFKRSRRQKSAVSLVSNYLVDEKKKEKLYHRKQHETHLWAQTVETWRQFFNLNVMKLPRVSERLSDESFASPLETH